MACFLSLSLLALGVGKLQVTTDILERIIALGQLLLVFVELSLSQGTQ